MYFLLLYFEGNMIEFSDINLPYHLVCYKANFQCSKQNLMKVPFCFILNIRNSELLKYSEHSEHVYSVLQIFTFSILKNLITTLTFKFNI